MSAQTGKEELTLAHHLRELRSRVIWVIAFVFVGATVAYIYRDAVQDIITRPLKQDLYYTSPIGGFNFIFQICLTLGVVFAFPAITYHVLKFVEPLIGKKVRFFILKRISVAILLFLCGVLFAYVVALPATLYFLNNFTSEGIEPLITTDEYLSFIAIYLLAFGLIFMLPLFMSIINDITPLDPGAIAGKRKHVFLGSFIIAGIVSPTPDPMNQTIMALPIVILFEVSITLIKYSHRKQARVSRKRQNKEMLQVHEQNLVGDLPDNLMEGDSVDLRGLNATTNNVAKSEVSNEENEEEKPEKVLLSTQGEEIRTEKPPGRLPQQKQLRPRRTVRNMEGIVRVSRQPNSATTGTNKGSKQDKPRMVQDIIPGS